MTSPGSRFSVNKAPAVATVDSIDESRCSAGSATAVDSGDMSPTTASVFENRRASLSARDVGGEGGTGGPPAAEPANLEEQPSSKTGKDLYRILNVCHLDRKSCITKYYDGLTGALNIRRYYTRKRLIASQQSQLQAGSLRYQI
jgi:hypothetical protein